MGNFRQDRGKRFDGNRGGGFNRRDDNRGGFGGDRSRGPVVMHQAICAQCGKSCEVPFKPTGNRPVYCNDCFGSKKETGSNRSGGRFESNANRGSDSDLKRQLEMLNSKMDRLIRAVEIMAKIKPLAVEEKKETIKTGPTIKAKKSAKKKSKK